MQTLLTVRLFSVVQHHPSDWEQPRLGRSSSDAYLYVCRWRYTSVQLQGRSGERCVTSEANIYFDPLRDGRDGLGMSA